MRLIALAFAAIVALTASPSLASSDKTITGRASVIDGDTIEIQGQRIRLDGIDAPESAQLCKDTAGQSWRCGQRASLALDKWLAGSIPTRCRQTDTDQYGRVIGRCYRADDASVQAWLVRNGWAMDWPRYSMGRYAQHQDQAKQRGAGIWRGEFVPPWEWRRGERLDWQKATLKPSGECRIKGNISRRGDRIYHVPGGQFYDQTVIDEAGGHRWFCTEGEAKAAGWRASRR